MAQLSDLAILSLSFTPKLISDTLPQVARLHVVINRVSLSRQELFQFFRISLEHLIELLLDTWGQLDGVLTLAVLGHEHLRVDQFEDLLAV